MFVGEKGIIWISKTWSGIIGRYLFKRHYLFVIEYFKIWLSKVLMSHSNEQFRRVCIISKIKLHKIIEFQSFTRQFLLWVLIKWSDLNVNKHDIVLARTINHYRIEGFKRHLNWSKLWRKRFEKLKSDCNMLFVLYRFLIRQRNIMTYI